MGRSCPVLTIPAVSAPAPPLPPPPSLTPPSLSFSLSPAGIDCTWTIGSASAYEGVTLTFNSVDVEPEFDEMFVWDGDDRATPLKTVRGKSSQCTKSDDCNPDAASSTPSVCTFANVADLYGTCTCEAGYANGDCSESKEVSSECRKKLARGGRGDETEILPSSPPLPPSPPPHPSSSLQLHLTFVFADPLPHLWLRGHHVYHRHQ